MNVTLLLLMVRSAYARIITRASDSVRTIAIVNLTSNIGDMICTTPLFRVVRESNPMARVIVVGSSKNKLLLAGSPDVDVYIEAPTTGAAIRALSTYRPDGGVATNPSPYELGILYCAGARRVTVFDSPLFASRAFRIMRRWAIRVAYTPGEFVPGALLRLLAPFDITSTDSARHLAVDPVVRDRVRQAYRAPYAAIAPRAGHAFKEWPRARFESLAEHVRARGITPVWTDSVTTLEELKALVAGATIAISNDSGVAQIAEAFNVPTLVIAGATDWGEHHVDRPLHRVVYATGDIATRSFVSDHTAVNEAKALAQMESITFEQVRTVCDEVLALVHKP